MIRAGVLTALLAGPAAAQDMAPGFDAAPVRACFDGAAPGEAAPSCIGTAAGLCMEASDGGYTTVGMAGCTSRETAEWDKLLNEVYRDLRAALEAEDARADPATGAGIDRSDALRDAQRAWIAFRDAECRLRLAQFQGGTISRLIGTGCVLNATARRALELRAIAAGGAPL